MKRYWISWVLIAALAVGIITYIGLWVNSMQDDIQIEEEVLYGDRKFAEDVEISSRTSAHYYQLLWQTDYTVGKVEDCKSRFTLNQKGQVRTEAYTDVNTYLSSNIQDNLQSDTAITFNDEEVDQGIMRTILLDVTSRTKPGEIHRETVDTADYYEYIPLHFYGSNIKHVRDAATEYFKIPVSEQSFFEVMIKKNSQREVIEFETKGDLGVEAVTVADTDGCFLTFSALGYGNSFSDSDVYQNGIHYIPFIEKESSYSSSEQKTADFSSAKMVYPLKEGIKPLALEESPDGNELFLIYIEGDSVYLSIIDKTTWKSVQKFYLRKTTENINFNMCLNKDNAFLFLFSDNEFSLLTEKDGKYKLEFSNTFEDIQETQYAYATEGIEFFGYHADIDFDGKKLVAVTTNDYRKFSNLLYVFDRDGLQYLGKYTYSADRKGAAGEVDNSRDFYPLKVTLPS